MASKKGNPHGELGALTASESKHQINKRLREVGKKQELLRSFRRGGATKIAKIRKTLAEQCEPHYRRVDELLSEIFELTKKYRKELTEGKRRRIIKLVAGIIGWRFTPYGTTIRNPKKVITWMQENGYGKYIRYVAEIDRQQLVRDRAKIRGEIPGVFIGRTEEFGVEPAVTKERVALPVKRLERLLKKRGKPRKKK